MVDVFLILGVVIDIMMRIAQLRTGHRAAKHCQNVSVFCHVSPKFI